MNTRREFLRMMGAITAGAVITPIVACSTDTNVISAPPNAYRLFKVLDGSANVAFTPRDKRITGADGKPLIHVAVEPMLSDTGRVVFVGLDESDRQGVYEMTLTFAPDPSASLPKLLVQVGQTLPSELGGGTVTELATLDLARNGELLIGLGLTDGAEARWSTLVVERGQGVELLVTRGARTTDGHELSGVHHDASIDAGNVLFVARYIHSDASTGTARAATGLFTLDIADRTAIRRLAQTGETPAGPDSPIRELGLIDLHGRDWVAQAFVHYNRSGAPGAEEPHTLTLRGTLAGQAPIVVAATLPELAAAAQDPSMLVADQLHAPRIQDGVVHHVAQQSSRMHAMRDGKPRHTSENTHSNGRKIEIVSPAVAGGSGAWCYLLTTSLGGATFRELVRVDASGTSGVILESGDQLANDGRTIWDINFGSLTQQMDLTGRVACTALFSDSNTAASAGTHPAAIVIGIPS